MRKLNFLKIRFGLEILLTDTAQRTYPVVGNIFERSSGSHAVVGVTYFRIIYPVANRASVLFHIAFY